MSDSDFLDRRIHYCKACKKSYCIRDLHITRAFYTSHNYLMLYVTCPNKHRLRGICGHKRKDRKVIEEYLESMKVSIK